MSAFNPGRGKLKPHLRKLRSGIWAMLYRDRDGHLFGAAQVSFMTSHSKRAQAAREWAAYLNSRRLANIRG